MLLVGAATLACGRDGGPGHVDHANQTEPPPGPSTPTGPSTPSTPAGSLRWLGRVDASDPAAVRFAWSGAGLIATVRGAEIAVKLRSGASGSHPVWFQPVVDGARGERFAVGVGAEESITLASGLSPGDHVVELYRESEGAEHIPVSTHLGFTSGVVVGAPAGSGRLLEVVGDSITAGYGNLGSETHPGWSNDFMCDWTTENSSWYQTYAAMAGRALSAEVSSVALSGWGLYSGAGDRSAVLGNVHGNALGAAGTVRYDFPRRADAVVVNLGTNDSNDWNERGYVDAGLALLAQLRAVYPEAWVFFSIGPMLGEPALSKVSAAQAAIVTQARAGGDTRVESFHFDTQPLGNDGEVPTGCNWHPDVAEHQRMADVLVSHLRQRLGW